jgi:hypothetical protein
MECFSCHIPMVAHQADAHDGVMFECDRCGHTVYPFLAVVSAPGAKPVARGTFSSWLEAAAFVFEHVADTQNRGLIVNRMNDQRTTINV